MCTVCGCESENPHDHDHGHDHSHHRIHEGLERHLHFGSNDARASVAGFSETQLIAIEKNILHKNQSFADQNRSFFLEQGVLAINLLSSPGAGKTSLLVKTIENLKGTAEIFVIEGDQETANDAERIQSAGVAAVQINTGKGCHLDAHMVGHALEQMHFNAGGLVLIENVGNLVCPSAFDLGETYKVVILSVTEGEDKPIKYPDMFAAADLMVVSKTDLLPYLKFDVDKAIEFANRINPDLQVIQLSAETGENMDEWCRWLLSGMPAKVSEPIRQTHFAEISSNA